jgi:hypothetical protein
MYEARETHFASERTIDPRDSTLRGYGIAMQRSDPCFAMSSFGLTHLFGGTL